MAFDFEKLEVYQKARAFKKRVYKLTDLFPEEEKYRLRLQMRKAALSMTNCIAEGHGRYSFKDRQHFMVESRGSLQELVDDINDCEDVGYAKPAHLADLKGDADQVQQILNGFIRYLRRRGKELGDAKVAERSAKSLNH
jgi:four helix bundle protein